LILTKEERDRLESLVHRANEDTQLSVGHLIYSSVANANKKTGRRRGPRPHRGGHENRSKQNKGNAQIWPMRAGG
jgi:hypothetical protein